MRKVLELIWGKWEPKYFSENQKKDSTGKSERRPTGKSTELRCDERTVSSETIPPLAHVRTRPGVLHAASQRQQGWPLGSGGKITAEAGAEARTSIWAGTASLTKSIYDDDIIYHADEDNADIS
jgi:hypothetical protein